MRQGTRNQTHAAVALSRTTQVRARTARVRCAMINQSDSPDHIIARTHCAGQVRHDLLPRRRLRTRAAGVATVRVATYANGDMHFPVAATVAATHVVHCSCTTYVDT